MFLYLEERNKKSNMNYLAGLPGGNSFNTKIL